MMYVIFSHRISSLALRVNIENVIKNDPGMTGSVTQSQAIVEAEIRNGKIALSAARPAFIHQYAWRQWIFYDGWAAC